MPRYKSRLPVSGWIGGFEVTQSYVCKLSIGFADVFDFEYVIGRLIL